MDIEFLPFRRFARGTILALLKDAYSFEPLYEQTWLENWMDADAFFYDHLEIADRCGFVTALDGKPIGFISWDPRNLPELVILGHNCIATEYKGNRYGKRQLLEAVSRIRQTACQKIVVTTDERLVPAQKNYESAGFRFMRFRENKVNPQYAGALMEYEMTL